MSIINSFNRGTSFFLAGLLFVIVPGCKRLVEAPAPVTSLTVSNVYTSDVTAAAVLTGIYTQLSSAVSSGAGVESMSFIGGISADELTLYSGVTNANWIACYQNSLSSQLTIDVWSNTYPYIYKTNEAIEQISASRTLSATARSQLLGEAKFLRAFFYFYLTNYYGDVPLVLNTDYTQTAIVPRTAQSKVYQQIIADLKDAQGLLSDSYVDATVVTKTTERTRPNKWVATAMLARVYLYTGDYPDAETQASTIIANSGVYALNTLANAFQKNNSEAIWQWQPVNTGYNTQDARMFILTSTGPNGGANPVYLTDTLLNSFEPGDMRRSSWVKSVTTTSGATYNYPYKYKVNLYNALVTSTAGMSEYAMILRLAEQFLLRAEARAMQGNITGAGGALADLNTIRHRANLGDYSGVQDKTAVLAAILHERQVELFTEWGHRWLDLKRTAAVDAIMQGIAPIKGGTWKSTAKYFPIVQTELLNNPDLVQTPGY